MTMKEIELHKGYQYAGMYNCSKGYMCQQSKNLYTQYQVRFDDNFNYEMNGVTLSIFNMSVVLFLSTTEYQSDSGYYLYGTGYRFANIGISAMRFYMNQSSIVAFNFQRALEDAYNYFNYQYRNRTIKNISDQLSGCYFRSIGYMRSKVGYSSNLPPDFILDEQFLEYDPSQFLGVIDVSKGQGYLNHTSQRYLGEKFFNKIVTKMFIKPQLFPAYFRLDEQVFNLFSPNCMIDINIIGHISVPIFMEIQTLFIICILILMLYMGVTINYKLERTEIENNFLFVVPQNIRNPKLRNVLVMYVLNFDVYLRFFEQLFVFILVIISKNSQMTATTQFTLIANIMITELVMVRYRQIQILKQQWQEFYPIQQDIRFKLFIQIMIFITFNQLYIEILNHKRSIILLTTFYILLLKDLILLMKLVCLKKEQILDKKIIILYFFTQILHSFVAVFMLMICGYNYNILEMQNRNRLITIYLIALSLFYVLQMVVLLGKYLYYSRRNMQYDLLYNKIPYSILKAQPQINKDKLYVAILYQQNPNDNMLCANPTHKHSQYYDQDTQDFIVIHHDEKKTYYLDDRNVLNHMPCFALLEYEMIKKDQSEISCPICMEEINFTDFFNGGYFDICRSIKKQQLQMRKQDSTKINVIFVKRQKKHMKSKRICWTPCGHSFHQNCIMQWIKINNSVCPVDKQPLKQQHNEYQ